MVDLILRYATYGGRRNTNPCPWGYPFVASLRYVCKSFMRSVFRAFPELDECDPFPWGRNDTLVCFITNLDSINEGTRGLRPFLTYVDH